MTTFLHRNTNPHLFFFSPILLFLLSFLTFNSVFAAKIWETDEEIIKIEGNYFIQMARDFDPRAEYGRFSVTVVNRANSVSTIFRGVCNPVVAVDISISDPRKHDFSAFLNSRSGKDLPIADVLEITRKYINSQCENLEVVRIDFKPAVHTKQDYSYQGTITRAAGWKLQDGFIKTDFDNMREINIAYRDAFSTAGTRYKGRCETDPVLVLEPIFTNNQEKAFAKPPKMSDFTGAASSISGIYIDKCPNTEKIRFILKPTPIKYTCKTTGDCFLITKQSDAWQPDTSQFKLKETNNPLADFNDISEVLAAGRFDIISDYKPAFFNFYFETFIGAYSDHCRALLSNPVERKIYTIEKKYDGDGSLVSERIDGPPRIIYVEKRYVETFDKLFGSWKAWAVNRTLNSTLKNFQKMNNPFKATADSFGFFTSNINQLYRSIKNNCRSNRIQTVYKNMYNYANNLPPITGKFKTDKKRAIVIRKNGSSAPKMYHQILQKYNQRIIDDRKRRQEARRSNQKSGAGKSVITPSISLPNSSNSENQGTKNTKKQTRNFQKEMFDLMQEHSKQLIAIGNEYNKKIKSAKDPQERNKLILELRKARQELAIKAQAQMLELRKSAAKNK